MHFGADHGAGQTGAHRALLDPRRFSEKAGRDVKAPVMMRTE